jgi:hypothetical protein
MIEYKRYIKIVLGLDLVKFKLSGIDLVKFNLNYKDLKIYISNHCIMA